LSQGDLSSTDIEPWMCQHCLRPNSIEAKPFARRKRKDFHLWLDPVVFLSLKNHCMPYRSMNNGLSMMMWELDKYRMMDSTQRLKRQIPVHSIEDETFP
jgi:hypothetical protein